MQLRQHLLLVEDRDDDGDERLRLPAQRTVHTIPSDTPAGSDAPALDQLGLAAHRQLEPAVERARRQVEIGLAVAVGAEALERAHHRHRRQHRAVEVGRHRRLPAVGAHPLAQQGARVAAVVVPGRVVLAPEPGVGRHRDDQRGARARPPAAARSAPGRRRAGARSRRWRTSGRSARPRRAAARSGPRARRAGRGAGRTRSPPCDRSTPSAGPSSGNSIRLRPVPQPASRMRGRPPAAARWISAQITRRRDRNHQWRSSMS